MSDHTELVKALRHCAKGGCDDCSYLEPCLKKWQENKNRFGASILMIMYDAAAAIEALEAANKELSEELLEAQVEKPHWISAELPPKENGAYVVWWNYKGTSYWFRGIFFDGRWLFEPGTPKPDYWMPIEPPQEVQDGTE